MLRLWPERLTAAIFPDICRLYGANGKEIGTYTPASLPGFDVVDCLLRVLDADPPRGRTEMEIIVSDSVARSIPLPWQDRLANDEQYEAYARACFEQAGFDLNDEWVVQGAYRHFRGGGLGYGLPRALVTAVENQLTERGIRLRSVMPMSAYAYWRHASGARSGKRVLLLREESRLSALLFDGKICAGLYVQPMGTGAADAARRLSTMLDTVFPEISSIQYWTPKADEEVAESIRTRFSVSDFKVLHGLGWS